MKKMKAIYEMSYLQDPDSWELKDSGVVEYSWKDKDFAIYMSDKSPGAFKVYFDKYGLPVSITIVDEGNA
jgi:hypothetical protein